MTRGELVIKIRENLNDAGVTFYSDDDLNDAIQDAYDDVAVFTGCIQKSANLTLTNSTTYYDMPDLISDYFTVVAAYNNTTNRWIDFSQIRELDGVRIDWELWSGQQPLFASVSNFRYLALAPRLESATGTITIFYRALAPELSSDSDTFLIHLDEQVLLEFYSTGDLLDQAEEFIKADGWWTQYFERLVKYKKRVGLLAASDYIPVLSGGGLD